MLAKDAFWKLSNLNTKTKNLALEKIADKLTANYNKILESNKIDLANAKLLVEKGELSQSLYKRLALSENKFKEMVNGVKDVAKLSDPTGKLLSQMELDNGLILNKVSCPIGVIGVIFEARPDVIVQISSLAIKSANCVILKGGSEAINTNIALFDIINLALKEIPEIPKGIINLITSREDVKQILGLDEFIDLIIPRGSNDFVKYIQNNTRIPVLGHSEGICHVYIDKDADLNMAWKVSLDSKIEYPAACNASESMLVHTDIVEKFLPEMIKKFELANVEVYCDKILIDKLKLKNVQIASKEDWQTEYNDLIISIKEVHSMDEAISHINKYGSGHTDTIITQNNQTAETFMNLVNSAGVFLNASTRFADGYRYGLGAEVGISTNKTHARGPVGLEGLLIYKYKLYGNGNIVDDYSKGKKHFNHKALK